MGGVEAYHAVVCQVPSRRRPARAPLVVGSWLSKFTPLRAVLFTGRAKWFARVAE